MTIKAIKGLGTAFLKRARAKAAEKMKKIDKKDTARFQGVYKKHMRALRAVNKSAVRERDKKVKEIKSRITKGKSKEDQREILAAEEKLGKSLLRTPKDKLKMYDDLPDIRQRFRGAPGPQRKVTRGIKNYMRRAGALAEDREKRFKQKGYKEPTKYKQRKFRPN